MAFRKIIYTPNNPLAINLKGNGGFVLKFDNYIAIRKNVEDAGLKVFEIMLQEKYNCKEIALGLPSRDKEMKFFQNFTNIFR